VLATPPTEAAGIDWVTLTQVEQYGVERLLGELAADLQAESSDASPTSTCRK
jgi:hypothetical protein